MEERRSGEGCIVRTMKRRIKLKDNDGGDI